MSKKFQTAIVAPSIGGPGSGVDLSLDTHINANGNTIWGLADPPSGSDWAVTKNYVDRLGTMLRPVKAVASANITLSGTQTIDSIACGVGDRVLATSQTAAKDNGIYVVASGAWSRATDADTAAEVARGTQVLCAGPYVSGSNYVNKTFTQTETITTVGTDAQNWDVVTFVDAVNAFIYPTPQGVGHVVYSNTQKALAAWDGGGWSNLGQPYICTSTTRPGFANDDMLIYETDTKKAYIRQGGAWVLFSSATQVPVHTRRLDTSGVSVTTATTTALAWATVEYTTGGITYSSGTGEFNVPVEGLYQVEVGVAWVPNTAGRRELIIRLNGTTKAYPIIPASSVSQIITSTVSITLACAANDKIGVYCAQTSGAGLAIQSTPGTCYLSITRIGPAS